MNNFGPSGSGFVGAEVCVYERTKLLAGNPFPGQVCFQLHAATTTACCPAISIPPTNPPSAEDQFFIGSVAAVNNHHLSLYSVHIDWPHPSQASITGNNNSQLIAVPPYTGPCGGPLEAIVSRKRVSATSWTRLAIA